MPSSLKRAFRNLLRSARKRFLDLERLAGRLWLLEARLIGVQCGKGITFHGRPVLGRPEGSQIILGDGVTLTSSPRSNPLTNAFPTTLRTLAPGAVIELKAGVGVSSSTICAARSITIGEGTIIGAGALILDSDCHRFVEEEGWITDFEGPAKPITIGREVFVGTRAIILKGVTIGDRAIIGAGAVITQDVPAGMIAVGNPPRLFPRKDL